MNCKLVQSISKVAKCFNGDNTTISLLGAMDEPAKEDAISKS